MKYQGKEIGIPTLEQIQEYISKKGFVVTAKEVYERFSKKKLGNKQEKTNQKYRSNG